jgi:hypothetical protein
MSISAGGSGPAANAFRRPPAPGSALALFERNALLTAWKNFDDELWAKLMPAILVTFLSRLETIVVAGNPGAERLRLDPFTGRLVHRDAADNGPGPAPAWSEKLRRHGPVEFARRVARRCGRELRRLMYGGRGFELSHPQALSHLRAMSLFLTVLDGAAAGREAARLRRKRSDRELCERFPLYLIPTYLGDEALFASAGFASLLPESPGLIRATLGEVMELPTEARR